MPGIKNTVTDFFKGTTDFAEKVKDFDASEASASELGTIFVIGVLAIGIVMAIIKPSRR